MHEKYFKRHYITSVKIKKAYKEKTKGIKRKDKDLIKSEKISLCEVVTVVVLLVVVVFVAPSLFVAGRPTTFSHHLFFLKIIKKL